MSAIDARPTRKKKSFLRRAYEQRQLFVLTVPFLLLVFVFNYMPIWGWLMAFQNYNPARGIWNSRWIGLDNFTEAFADRNFHNAIANTLSISALRIVLGFATAILLALLLNEVRSIIFKRVVQTISYLPYFISWVVASSIVYMTLSPSGIVNTLLVNLGFVEKGIQFMGEPKYFYGIVGISHVWKNVGWNAIIYLAAMTGIDQELYEAAAVDGAGRLRRIWAITLPSILPTIKILLVLAIGTLMSASFEHIYLLSNPSNISASRTIEVYVYVYAMRGGRFSYGTAIGIFNSAVSISLIMISNWVSKRIDGYGIF
ncbi:MAG: ABC transporter permease subunit [Oscillospiraceae bacterium]|nr:ABC transporter permease subunit [Oscillospiraceae bacterium]